MLGGGGGLRTRTARMTRKAAMPNTVSNTTADTTVVDVKAPPPPADTTLTVNTGVVEASVVQVRASEPR